MRLGSRFQRSVRLRPALSGLASIRPRRRSKSPCLKVLCDLACQWTRQRPFPSPPVSAHRYRDLPRRFNASPVGQRQQLPERENTTSKPRRWSWRAAVSPIAARWSTWLRLAPGSAVGYGSTADRLCIPLESGRSNIWLAEPEKPWLLRWDRSLRGKLVPLTTDPD